MPPSCSSQTPWLAMAITARSQPGACWAYSTPSSPLEAPVLVHGVRTDVHALLMPPPADLRHWGEDHGDLHPVPGAGSLCDHSCYQGFRWARREPLQRWVGGGVRKKREQEEAESCGERARQGLRGVRSRCRRSPGSEKLEP